MNRIRIALVLALVTSACGRHDQTAAGGGDGSSSLEASQAALNNGTADYTSMEGGMSPPATGTPDFVGKAAISDMYEITAAGIALKRSNNAEVKRFAQQMIEAHSATTAQLKAIVAKDKLPNPPGKLDAEHQDLVNELNAASADDFDDTYIDQQQSAHTKTLDLMKGYAAGGDNPDLKAFATQTFPKVQGHLTMAKAMDDADAGGTTPAKPAG